MDAFSQVLSDVRLKGALYFTAELSAPWSMTSNTPRTMTQLLAPGERHLIVFHLLVDGAATAALKTGERLTLTAGDIVVFPHGDQHVMSDGSSTAQIDGKLMLKKIIERDLSPMIAGGGGRTSRFICGYLTCDPLLCGPILDSLPAILKVNVRTDRAGQWLEQSMVHMVDEAVSNRAGSDAMLAKLSEALFVDTLRRYVSSLPDQTTGWLAGASDPMIGRSLALLHGRPHHAWTIASLAQAVGTSRSTLVERFTRYLAEPPMAYLTGWRLRLAAQSLVSTARAIADIAAEVGYESEAAFNRAFKRTFGLPPARYRRQARPKT